MLKGFVPDLTTQLDNVTAFLFDPSKKNNHRKTDQFAVLRSALQIYARSYLRHARVAATEIQDTQISTMISDLELADQSATTQKRAFGAVGALMAEIANTTIAPEDALALRESAREYAGLGQLGQVSGTPTVLTIDEPQGPKEAEKRMLDVEVVAMYW